MREIAREAQDALADLSDKVTLKTFWNSVHRLAGSAATFGYHKITVRAKRLEHVLDGALTNGTEADEKLRRTIRMLVSELAEATELRHPDSEAPVGSVTGSGGVADEQVASPAGHVESTADRADSDEHELDPESTEAVDVEPIEVLPDGESEDSSGSQGTRRLVQVCLHDAEFARALAEELGLYGFETRLLGSLTELLEMSCPRCQVAVVADLEFLRESPDLAERLRERQQTSSGRLHYIYLSTADTFDVRLCAVRAGGSMFLNSPVDAHRILDAVDALVSAGAQDPYHVMIVDDDREQVSYHALILQQAGMITSVVSEPNQMFGVLIEAKPELILMDMYMPDCTGLELATMIRQQQAFVGIPIVFLSVETDDERQIEAVSRGGDGFLIKPVKPEHLVATIQTRVERYRSMRFFMERDSLTGLLNHTHLIQALSKEVQRAERVRRSVCFAMIDVDHFKRVNDLHGHLTGDRVLKTLTRHLTERLRKTDVVGRYGGEEFGVVLFNVDVETAVKIMDTIRAEFAEIDHEAGDSTFNVTFSCGIAGYPEYDGPGPISEAADRGLYEAKEAGRNRVVSV